MISTSRICSTFLHFLCRQAREHIPIQPGELHEKALSLSARQYTGSQQRKLGAAIHAPFDQFEPVHMSFERTLAAIGSESPASTAALSRFGFLWQTISTLASGSLLPN
jgi:hypothetical protein